MDIYVHIMAAVGATTKPFRVGIYPVPGFALVSYACAVEPFRAANLLSKNTLYEVTHFDDGVPSQSSGAAIVHSNARIGDLPALDLMLVIAGGDPSTFDRPDVTRWLRQLARRGAQLGGVSAGPFILAQCGLMENRRMTVHWEHSPALEELRPNLLLERRLFVIDRDRITCGGGTAPLDMMHALIRQHHGEEFARRVSDWFLHTGIRAASDPQRAGLTERLKTHSAPVVAAVGAMEEALSSPLTLGQIADAANVSPRHLNRLFREHFGQSTMEYYRNHRLRAALQMIENSTISLTDISLATGFASSAHFSRLFSEYFGYAPSKRRRKQG